jgi:hypothetical protein
MEINVMPSPDHGRRLWHRLSAGLLIAALIVGLAGAGAGPTARAQGPETPAQPDRGTDGQFWYEDAEIEQNWHPDYLVLATGNPDAIANLHGTYAWPVADGAPFTIGHVIQSYQFYGGTPYFHHGIDIMAVDGTGIYSRSGGQVINVERYSTMYLYWEVAVLDPDGYIWVYHHIERRSIPQLIWDKLAEWQADPVNGGFIPADTHIGDIVKWTDKAFGFRRFNHIHLNILAAGGVYVNGFEFHTALADADAPEVLEVGLLQGGTIYPGNEMVGDYSLYVHARDLVLDDMYYLPPYEVTFTVDGGPANTTWRFDDLPGGANDKVYLNDFYVSPTCGDYHCREFYIDVGFVRDSQYAFPATGGPHTVVVTVRDYAGNEDSVPFSYTVIAPPEGTTVWQDTLESDLGWVRDPDGTDTASLGMWERGDPEATDFHGAKQLGTTAFGSNDLVTGGLAGPNAHSYDIDGGVTSMRSPAITLPAEGDLALSFYYYLAHGTNSSAYDYLRVTVVGSSTATVFEELGAAEDDDAAWALETVSLNAYAGQTVYLLLEAADAGPASLVEAAIDDLSIVSRSAH